MSTDASLPASPPPAATAPRAAIGLHLFFTVVLGAIASAALVAAFLLWQRLGNIQEQLARQSADAGSQASEARTLARDAQDQARDAVVRLTGLENRVNEVALQRSQLEELMQSLSRSRDENLITDVDASIRLAQQQAQITGSLQPMVMALHNARQRIERAAQPRLAPLLRALEQDNERLERASVTDTAGLLGRLDEVIRQVDELPLTNRVAEASQMRRTTPTTPPATAAAPKTSAPSLPAWQHTLQKAWDGVREQTSGLVRVTRIDRPDAMLLAPEQAYFLRQNLRLQLLNVRLSVLARRLDNARAELSGVGISVGKYFDPTAQRTQKTQEALAQLQTHMRSTEIPELTESLAALATAAAGR